MKNFDRNSIIGGIESISAYLIWGFFPLFWRLLSDVNSIVLLANRIIFSCLFIFIVILLSKKEQNRFSFLKNKKTVLLLISSSIIIAFNSGVYIWSVNNGYVIQASMGYYISPLVAILFSVVFMGERFDFLKILASLIAFFGIFIMIVKYKQIPYIALALAISFAMYGLIKKNIKVSASVSLFLETLLIVPFALIFLYSSNFLPAFSIRTYSLFVVSGIVTGVPLLLFARGVQKIKFSTSGFILFLDPTIMFLLGAFVYKESIEPSQMRALIYIWMAVAIFIVSLFYSINST